MCLETTTFAPDAVDIVRVAGNVDGGGGGGGGGGGELGVRAVRGVGGSVRGGFVADVDDVVGEDGFDQH